MVIVVSEDLETRLRAITRMVLREPFTKRTWSELLYLIVGAALTFVSFAFVGITVAAGVIFAITFFGFAIIGLSVRGSRGLGGIYRRVARSLLNMEIDDPEPFAARQGFLGWLQSALRDRTGWRAMAYIGIKIPLVVFGFLTAFSVWFAALTCLIYPFAGGSEPHLYGLVRVFFNPGPNYSGGSGGFRGMGIFVVGVFLFFIAPWAVRALLFLERSLMRGLLAPDALAVRVRSLETARAQTVDASAATLRRIERDLHDGTQAQLVALAMQLGMAKEKLENADDLDLDEVRQLVNDAHIGAKEAIVELRDLARGIHPPALDIGLKGALSTLAARSTVPTELTVSLHDRPTPSIEAIAYFCVAELLANVAQHAEASRATVTCTQDGRWLRLVVRDDGKGGAQVSRIGSTSSGLTGLVDRVEAVDGRFDIASPERGPTVVTVDLPLHA
jgi:signal transduction histidine kinase